MEKIQQKKKTSLNLIGIVHSNGKRGALIEVENERLSVFVGDSVGSYNIHAIADDHVILKQGKKERRLEL